MCSEMRRGLLKIAIVVLLGVPVVVLALAPGSDHAPGSPTAVVSPAAERGDAGPALPEEAAMVLAGTVLIGVAAAVRRAA
jgi:hypothetical protein